jgi:hypothetical protein
VFYAIIRARERTKPAMLKKIEQYRAEAAKTKK